MQFYYSCSQASGICKELIEDTTLGKECNENLDCNYSCEECKDNICKFKKPYYTCSKDKDCPGNGTCNSISCTCPCHSTYPKCTGWCNNNPGNFCTYNADTKSCECLDPCHNSLVTAPQCNGYCDEGEICLPKGSGTACECKDISCSNSEVPRCGGKCAVPDELCRAYINSDDELECTCMRICITFNDCSYSETCENGLCVPKPPCESTDTPACNGTCPDDKVCIQEETSCNCVTLQPESSSSTITPTDSDVDSSTSIKTDVPK